jgi:dipeptidyl aminopeptidase/acylaminoacyl peptidase
MARLRPFRPDDLYRLRVVGDPQLSADGKHVAYVVGRHDKDADEVRSQIWVASVDGATAPRQFSTGDHDNSPRWSPDGRALLFVGRRGDGNGGGQLLLAPLDGGEPRALTSAPHGVSQPAWSPDGSAITYIARVGPAPAGKDAPVTERRAPRVIRNLSWRFDGIGVLDERRPHVFVLDVAGGDSRQLTSGDYAHESPTWSPDGSRIAFVSDRRRQRHDEVLRSDLWVVPVAGGRPTRVTRARGMAAFPAWSPDGRQLAFIGGEDGDNFWSKNAELLVVDADGASPPRAIGEGFARLGVPEGQLVQWSADGKGVLAVCVERGAAGIHRYDLDGGSRVLVAGERRIGGFTTSADQRRVAFVATWVGEPGEVYVASLRATGRASGERMVSDANDELRASVALAGCTRMKSTAPDGIVSESFVVTPPHRDKRPLPLVLDIHGGPHGWHPGTYTTTWAITQTLAGAGFAVLMPNPRGSGGYGDEFLAGCVQDWGGGDFDDLMAAVDAAVETGLTTERQLFVWGYSYGGFMTTWTVGHTNRFRAAVVGAPVVDQLSMIGTTDIPYFAAHEVGGLPWDRPDEYAKRSPLTYAPDIDTPVMIILQDGDLRCPPGQCDELFAALKLLDKEVEYVRYPGGFHAMGVSPFQLIDRARRTIAWFKDH